MVFSESGAIHCFFVFDWSEVPRNHNWPLSKLATLLDPVEIVCHLFFECIVLVHQPPHIIVDHFYWSAFLVWMHQFLHKLNRAVSVKHLHWLVYSRQTASFVFQIVWIPGVRLRGAASIGHVLPYDHNRCRSVIHRKSLVLPGLLRGVQAWSTPTELRLVVLSDVHARLWFDFTERQTVSILFVFVHGKSFWNYNWLIDVHRFVFLVNQLQWVIGSFIDCLPSFSHIGNDINASSIFFIHFKFLHVNIETFFKALFVNWGLRDKLLPFFSKVLDAVKILMLNEVLVIAFTKVLGPAQCRVGEGKVKILRRHTASSLME